MKHILITGGTGLVGTHLTPMLLSKGYEVAYLSRTSGTKDGIKKFAWDVQKGTIDVEALKWADAIIHLAGAGVADKKWSESRKKVILESRTETTKLLYNTLKLEGIKLDAFVSASAMGYYGFKTSDHIYKETDAPGDDFLAQVVIAWEQAVQMIKSLDIRTAMLRVGVVLAKEGGALKQMNFPPVLAPLGSGKQWFPWVHVEDLAQMFVWALEDTNANGPYNAVGLDPKTNKTFTKTLAKVSGKPFLPIGAPAFALKAVMGEMANMILEGSRVSSDKILQEGFDYKFNDLESALKDLDV